MNGNFVLILISLILCTFSHAFFLQGIAISRFIGRTGSEKQTDETGRCKNAAKRSRFPRNRTW